MSKSLEEKESQTVNRFQWFLLVIAIPSLFAVVVALVILSFAGINVFKTAAELGEKVPFISKMVNSAQQPTIEEYEKNIISLEAEIKDREAKMEQLTAKIDSRDREVDRMQLEKKQLEAQIEELTAIQEENKRAFKDIVKTYETMSAKKAAPILASMESDQALKILSNIKPDTLAAIMEKLPAEDAAKFTELLTNKPENDLH